ncbi:hypothetical protein [Kitasatospora griseola]|uniref:hypothetical protein n=1 Tax=Kitasatospora griseola TaxID=2064 RepID=UPI00167180B2|nr:hypothetical protein [Kitasatospora griseola]GGQ91426.1 hypothetical protein GCM10010195_54210 [Kitasatospora griseola]
MVRTLVNGAGIAEPARLPAVVDGGTGDRCPCSGRPTIIMHDIDGESIACRNPHHGTGLRGLGDRDAEPRDGSARTAWPADRGLTGSRDVQAELAEQAAERERRRLRRLDTAPVGVRAAAEAVAVHPGRDLEAWSGRAREAEAQLIAQVQQGFPDRTERIQVLSARAGASARAHTGGLTWYDRAVEQHLLAEEPGRVLAALTAGPPGPGPTRRRCRTLRLARTDRTQG